MHESFPSNTCTVHGNSAADGDTQLAVTLYTHGPNNRSHVCVLDSVTWAYTNTSGTAQELRLNVTPNGSTYPIWQARVTVPANESATIDKSFVHGLPLWKTGTPIVQGAGTDEARVEFVSGNGSAFNGSGATVVAGAITPYIDDAPWITFTPHGPGVLSATSHIEPAGARSY